MLMILVMLDALIIYWSLCQYASGGERGTAEKYSNEVVEVDLN